MSATLKKRSDPLLPTPRQLEIFAFALRYWARRGFPPTVREIGRAFGIRSPNGVMCHLNALRDKGYMVGPSPEDTEKMHDARGWMPRGVRFVLLCEDTPEGQLCQEILGGAA